MRAFAVIPAAGRSRRMGQPKLLLPWGGSTVIEHVLAVWQASRVERCVVVVHRQDEPLAALCRNCGADVVVPPVAPPEMKDSVLLALEFLAATCKPSPHDAWLLAPADMPTLDARVIDRLIEAHAQSLNRPDRPPCVRAPRYAGKQAHPVLFSWPLAAEVARLGPDEGLNVLVARQPVETLEAAGEERPDDLDTPEDYDRLRARYEP